MAIIAHVLSTSETSRPNVAKAIRRKTGPLKYWLAASSAAIVIASAGSATADDITLAKAPPLRVPSAYDWNGFYAGGHVGQAWGTSNWTSTPGIAGSTNLYQPFNGFDGTGSIFAGLQAGYNYMLPNRFLLGAEVDATLDRKSVV